MFSEANTTIPRVLIIEKGEGMKNRLGERIAESYEFFSCSSIDESLAVIKAMGIHCIILDIATFGREDGFLGTRRIKATHSNGKLPVVAVLPEADPGLKTDSLLAGCTTFIIQPVSAQALDVVISEVLTLTASYRQPVSTHQSGTPAVS